MYELGREGDLDLIVMVPVEATPLSKLSHGRPLPAHNVVAPGAQAARALSRAHRKRPIHRDLESSNLFDRADSTIGPDDSRL